MLIIVSSEKQNCDSCRKSAFVQNNKNVSKKFIFHLLQIGDFQALRAVVQNTTHDRLQFNVQPLHAIILDVQLRNVTYPPDWSNAVALKEQASYDITLASQERQQAISKVRNAYPA